jgi:outer membrane protein OmpA-like peptidoglycan-associated protein
MNALIAKGIEQFRLSAKGWGQDKPISDNTTEEGKAKNRRVEIVKL